jgi:competence protein ComFC
MRWWSSLFPAHPSCWFCEQPLARVPFARAWSHICMDCKLLLSPLYSPGCEVCCRPLSAGESLCNDCVLVPPMARVLNVSVMAYTKKTKRVIARFKYAGDERLAVPMAALMQEIVDERYKNIPIHVVTSVPLHRSRLVERGFNQAHLLAEQLPILLACLRKCS